MIATQILAERAFGSKVGVLGANDAARSSFSAQGEGALIALSPDLEILGRWPVDPQHRGHHATWPAEGLALVSGRDEVRLIDQTGQARWRYHHPPWRWALESGCTWFDQAGQPYAVVPAESYDHCLVVALDQESRSAVGGGTSQGPALRDNPDAPSRRLGWPVRRRRAGRVSGMVGPLSKPNSRSDSCRSYCWRLAGLDLD
jgi:hypothetical protein